MPSKVVTIGYLKTFVSGILSVSTAYNDDRYCPTYAELTGGSLVTNYKSDTNPTKTTNGIRINGCSVGTSYSSNQLVVEPDLELLYQQLQSISVSAAKTTVGCCATSTTLSTTAYFKLVTKTTGGTSTASTSTSASVSASYSEDESFTSISGNKISFTKNTVNTSNCTGAPARSSEVTGSYTYSGSTKTNTVTITQSANNIDSYWTNTSTSTYDVSVSPTSMSFGSAGGTKSYTVTRHYTQYQEKYDDCGTAVCFNSYNTSTTVTPSSASASGDFTCTKSNVSIGVNSGSARSGTLTVSYGGYNATCSLSQGASQAGTTNGEPYNYDYYLSVSTPSRKISCDGGSATFTARYVTTWDYDWETKNDAGEVTNSGTSSDSSSTNVTNSAEWSTTVGSVSKGTLTLGAYDEDTRRTATVTAKYNGYSDSDYVYQESCAPDTPTGSTVTSTTYTYRIDAADFDACDSETTVTVYATPTYHYSDGSTITGEETEISVFPLPTITYRLGTGETTVTASENSTSSSRIWTVLASFKHNNSTHTASDTATQSAGPCNTGSTVYQYTFKNCYTDKQIGLFASNATPSGSHLQFAMLSALDGTAATVLVTSNNGTLVNGSTSNSSSSAKIGDSVKVYSVTNTTNIWTLEETITLTASNRSFEYGCSSTPTSCTCTVSSISVSPSSYTFTSRSEKKDFTVTISNNGCDKCQGYFLYNPDGIYMGPGTNNAPFTLYGSSQSGNYKVVAMDNTGITKTVKVVADIPEDPVYVMQKTSGDTSTSITFPGGTTYLPYPGYICCYSTKDGVKQSVTASSDSTWLTVSENNDLPYDGANYNFKFDQTENTSTSSRTGKITITQSGSNKKVVWTIVQAGKPNYVFKFNNPTDGFDSSSTETHIIHKPVYEGGGPTTTLTSTKDGSNIGYTMSSNVTWITTSTAATTCSWEIKKNTSSESRSGLITLTQSGSNKTMQISVTQGGAPATKTCNPLFLSYDDASHKMTATFDEMVSSDVTINFKVNVNNSAIITDSIKISEGNNTNSKTLSTSQAITSTAGTSISISSISPSSDSEYEYNCDTDWEIIPSEAPSVKCEQYKVDFDALGSWNEPGSAYVETYQKETCTDESLSININGTLQYPGGYLGTNQTFDINLVISNIACEFQFADASTNSGNLSYNGMALTMTYINPDVLLSEGSISIDATFIYNIEGETKTGSVSIWLNIMEV